MTVLTILLLAVFWIESVPLKFKVFGGLIRSANGTKPGYMQVKCYNDGRDNDNNKYDKHNTNNYDDYQHTNITLAKNN